MFKERKKANMKEIEKLIDKSIEFYEVDFDMDLFQKVRGRRIEPGKRVKIIWDEEYGFIDYGYIFNLPGFHDDEWDLAIHIPEVYCEKGGGHPEWVHISELVSNEHIKIIEIIED